MLCYIQGQNRTSSSWDPSMGHILFAIFVAAFKRHSLRYYDCMMPRVYSELQCWSEGGQDVIAEKITAVVKQPISCK